MAKSANILRGLGMISAVALAASITTGAIMEQYPSSLDTFFGTLSSQVVSEKTEEADWIYQSKFQTAKAAFEGFKEFSVRASQETSALLKNTNNALPIAKNAKITLMGLRSYAAVYGNNGGSTPDTKTVEDNKIYDVFKEEGFQINPSMLATYETYCSSLTWAPASYGNTTPSYRELNVTNEIPELSPAELAEINPDYKKDFSEYSDAAIVVVGRPGGESYNYVPGGQDTTTGNIFGLSSEEKAVIAEAKENFDKVIVLVNSTQQMEIGELKNDPDIDAILWIGYPGAYGFYGVAQVLNGTVSPSAHLGDIYAANTAVNPAMRNFGAETPWQNIEGLEGANVNTYLVEAEGIYTGYRYYETRYADIVGGTSGASSAKAGTYVNADGTAATTDGTWNYSNEVVYPFGYGLSYTTFRQTLDEVSVMGDKKTANVTVTVTNTGTEYSGKSVVQLYAQTPYTDYDKRYGVEKSALQLIDYEKTETLAPGKSQTITMKVDLSNLASYDYTNAKTFIVDDGDYYFAIGDDSHDALNNILAAQGKTVANGMTADGDESKTYRWTWSGSTGGVDDKTFSVSKAGVAITNAVTEGQSAMDFNYFAPGTVTYLSRSNWDGTYPKTYSGLSATTTDELYRLLSNDFYELQSGENTSEFVWGDTKSALTLNDMKGADFNDSRWDEIVNKVTIEEFLNFAGNAFHNIEEIPSVGYVGNNADDGPNGSDSHYFQEGSYQGKAYEDAEDYTGYGTRVGPSATNLAYTFNKELAYENGEMVLGESTLILGLPIMIGPGMNLHRHAYNGRGGEYYSEDPILSGYTGSAVVQGAQSKGTLVNIKHAAFNDQEINRSGIAVFMNEQKAREMELRNLQQAFEANGKPASYEADESKNNTYTAGARGVMTSYNRIGATASSANYGVQVQIIRGEWNFKGYNVTDFTGVSLRAAPKESLLCGTTAFCGFGGGSFDYWNSSDLPASAAVLKGDYDMCVAIKSNIKNVLYALANSAAVNGTNNTQHRVQLMCTWRVMYISLEAVFGATTGALLIGYAVAEVLAAARKKKEVK